eukprot:5762878-Prorocentrum_lima.AAC.1
MCAEASLRAMRVWERGFIQEASVQRGEFAFDPAQTALLCLPLNGADPRQSDSVVAELGSCLLYTSDAADDM